MLQSVLVLVGGLLPLAGCHLIFPYDTKPHAGSTDGGPGAVAQQDARAVENAAGLDEAGLDAHPPQAQGGDGASEASPTCTSWSDWTNLEECRTARCEATCGGNTINCRDSVCSCNGTFCYTQHFNQFVCLCEMAFLAGCCNPVPGPGS